MTYKGIAYTVIPNRNPGHLQWQFQIGDEIKSGKTETRLELLAMRRAELRINRELSKFRTGNWPAQRIFWHDGIR